MAKYTTRKNRRRKHGGGEADGLPVRKPESNAQWVKDRALNVARGVGTHAYNAARHVGNQAHSEAMSVGRDAYSAATGIMSDTYNSGKDGVYEVGAHARLQGSEAAKKVKRKLVDTGKEQTDAIVLAGEKAAKRAIPFGGKKYRRSKALARTNKRYKRRRSKRKTPVHKSRKYRH
tara:strand:+ start:6307 stop:6831 length:525 start_codon:yes stop_codon:yes gene_type:complete